MDLDEWKQYGCEFTYGVIEQNRAGKTALFTAKPTCSVATPGGVKFDRELMCFFLWILSRTGSFEDGLVEFQIFSSLQIE